MQILQIKPSTPLLIKPPNTLQQFFSLANLTLHPVCVYIVPIHQDYISVTPNSAILEAFQEIQIKAIAHWNQTINTNFRSKIRVYIWQIYEESFEIQSIKKIMFNKQTDGNCLMFQQINLHFELDHNFFRSIYPSTTNLTPRYYSVRNIMLPNHDIVKIDQKINDKLLEHCEKLGKVKGIYTYDRQFVIYYIDLNQTLCSFFEIRDQNDNLALFVIGCLCNFGNSLVTPNIINLNIKQISQIRNNKNSNKNQVINLQNKQVQGIKSYHHNHNPKIDKKSLKQSFMIPNRQIGKGKRRNKSQQSIRIPIFEDQQQQQIQHSHMIDVDWIKDSRKGKSYESKINQQYIESIIEFNKKVLNAQIGEFDGTSWIFLLFLDSVLACDTGNISNKWKIKFQPIDRQNMNLRTPMILTKEQIIFGNDSYLYWVNLKGNNSTWKYVQRKQIYCLEVVEQLNLLVVGGKTFSKLSYLGKSTHRTNVKIFSGGKTGKHDHLFTYDVPNCGGDNVVELKYITTKPSGTKLLLILTDSGLLNFVRVRSFKQFEIYSQIHCHEIGIQQIVSLSYDEIANQIICLQRLDEQNLCFKTIKIGCSYQKVELSTQSIKLPVCNYEQQFELGIDFKTQNCWITAIKKNGQIVMIWLDSRNTNLIEKDLKKNVKFCYIVSNGYIFRERNCLRYKLLK